MYTAPSRTNLLEDAWIEFEFVVLARFSISVFLASFSPLAHESSAAISDLRAAFSESSFPSSFAMSVMRA